MNTGPGDAAIHMAYEKGVDIRATTSILFKVKGCNDALLRLYETNDQATSDAGTIVLGGWSNDKCVLKPCSLCANRYSIRYPFLNCNELRPMWVNWTGRLLSVGEGEHVGERTFMSTDELRTFDYQYLAVFSNWKVKVDWVFSELHIKLYSVCARVCVCVCVRALARSVCGTFYW